MRWQALIRTRRNLRAVLNRRHLEVCVFTISTTALRCGDVYVEGSAAYADYRQQLLPWDECVPRSPPIARRFSCAPTAAGFVAELRERLREVAHRVDATYPENTALTIDQEGTPHLKRLPRSTGAGGPPNARSLAQRADAGASPARYPQKCAPLGGLYRGILVHLPARIPNSRMPFCAIIFTVFGYASELGASQTARHTMGPISRHVLRRH